MIDARADKQETCDDAIWKLHDPARNAGGRTSAGRLLDIGSWYLHAIAVLPDQRVTGVGSILTAGRWPCIAGSDTWRSRVGSRGFSKIPSRR
jgi:hypothetical protein